MLNKTAIEVSRPVFVLSARTRILVFGQGKSSGRTDTSECTIPKTPGLLWGTCLFLVCEVGSPLKEENEIRPTNWKISWRRGHGPRSTQGLGSYWVPTWPGPSRGVCKGQRRIPFDNRRPGRPPKNRQPPRQPSLPPPLPSPLAQPLRSTSPATGARSVSRRRSSPCLGSTLVETHAPESLTPAASGTRRRPSARPGPARRRLWGDGWHDRRAGAPGRCRTWCDGTSPSAGSSGRRTLHPASRGTHARGSTRDTSARTPVRVPGLPRGFWTTRPSVTSRPQGWRGTSCSETPQRGPTGGWGRQSFRCATSPTSSGLRGRGAPLRAMRSGGHPSSGVRPSSTLRWTRGCRWTRSWSNSRTQDAARGPGGDWTR